MLRRGLNYEQRDLHPEDNRRVTDGVVGFSEPPLDVLMTFFEDNILPVKERLAACVAATPGLEYTVAQSLRQGASVEEIYGEVRGLLSDSHEERRALDVWYDYRKAIDYCQIQWSEWYDATLKKGPLTRMHVLGLWQLCASLTATEVEEMPLLIHVDRLIWYLAHIVDEAVDDRTPAAAHTLAQKGDGIIRTLRTICEFYTPDSRDLVYSYARRYQLDYMSHEPHALPSACLIEQIHHKLIPDTITARFYNEVLEIIAGDIMNGAKATLAMREALYVWQLLDDIADCDQDNQRGLANIAMMCLRHTGEQLPDSGCWPTAEQAHGYMPKTVTLLRHVFSFLCQWLDLNRPDVLAFLFSELERVYPVEWHCLLKDGKHYG